MDIDIYKKRIFKNAQIKNSIIVFSILIPMIILNIWIFFILTEFRGLLFLFLGFQLLLFADISINLWFNRFLYKVDVNDLKVVIKGEITKIKFRHYIQHYYNRGHGAKSHALSIKVNSDNKEYKLIYPFKNDIDFGIKKQDWNNKSLILQKLSYLSIIELTFLKKSKVIIKTSNEIENILRKFK